MKIIKIVKFVDGKEVKDKNLTMEDIGEFIINLLVIDQMPDLVWCLYHVCTDTLVKMETCDHYAKIYWSRLRHVTSMHRYIGQDGDT